MGHLSRNEIPAQYSIADSFTICDMYMQAVIGPLLQTESHRLPEQSTFLAVPSVLMKVGCILKIGRLPVVKHQDLIVIHCNGKQFPNIRKTLVFRGMCTKMWTILAIIVYAFSKLLECGTG